MSLHHRFHLTFCLTLCLCAALGVQAQTRSESPRYATVGTASRAAGQVRFAGLPSVFQLRLEVFAATGAKVFDSDFKSSNLLDWALLLECYGKGFVAPSPTARVRPILNHHH